MPLPLLAIAGIAAAGAGAGALIAEHNDQEWWKGALIGGTLGLGGAVGLPALAGAGGLGGLSGMASGAAGLLGLGGAQAAPAAVAVGAPAGAVGAGFGGPAAGVGAGFGGPAAGVGAGFGSGLSSMMPPTVSGAMQAGQLARVLTPEEQALDAETVAFEQARDAAQAEGVTPDQEDGWFTTENRKKVFDLVDNVLGGISEEQRARAQQQTRITPPYQVFPPYWPVGGPGMQGLGSLPITQRMISGPLNF